MAKYSASGKLIGRPPKAAADQAPPTDQEAALGRAFSKYLNRYDAAGKGRRMASWSAPSTGPNEAIAGGLQTLRDRSSDAVRNDWSGSAIVQTWATNLVGIAITPRFRKVRSAKRRKEVSDIWNSFVRTADADGVLDLYGMQTLAVRAWIERGEMFARRRYRSKTDKLPLPVQVQLLESDMVPNFDADTFEGMRKGNTIQSGIEFNRRGRIEAYWVYRRHPGDTHVGMSVSPAANDLVRVPAEDMLHMYEPKRIGQRRGVPEMAAVLARLRSINDYEDVTLERQKLANLFVAFIRRTLPTLDPTDPNYGALSGLEAELTGDGSPLMPMAPGLMQELEDGQDVQFANPPDPSTTYSDYMRTSHLGTAAGSGLPYELMSGDIQGVSDRAMRVVINEFRRFASQRQWQIVIPQFCQRIIQWFADAAVLENKIALSEHEEVTQVEHAPHGWEYIHPVQDVQGKALEVKNGFRSRSSVISEFGDDPDLIDQERAEDAEREMSLNLPITGLPDGVEQPGSRQEREEDVDGIEDDEYNMTPNPAGAGVRQKLEKIASLERAAVTARNARAR